MSADDRVAASLDDIVDAAAKVFLREGYKGSTMEQVAAEVKLHKTSLYHHIRSKEALLIAVCDLALGYSVSRVDEIRNDDSLSPCQKVRAAVKQHIEILTSRPEASAAFTLFAHHIGDPQARRKYLVSRGEYASQMEQIIAAGLAVHGRDDDPRLVTYAVLGQCNWMQHWYRPDGPYAAGVVADTFADLAVRVVGCDGCQD